MYYKINDGELMVIVFTLYITNVDGNTDKMTVSKQ